MINFISNLPRDLRSGGFSAMNFAAFSAIAERKPVRYVGPVNPMVFTSQKLVSKALRLSGFGGDFFFFSQRRLRTIAREVDAQCAPQADLDFFHGFTPWILTRPARPYVSWSDCTFRDYISIYHRRADFRAADLARIEATEATWMQGAHRLAFTSAWAAGRAIADYGLDPARIAVVGIFGEADLPNADVYAGAREFAFVSTNFEAKGGPVVLAALRHVRARHPDASLVVVGDAPTTLKSEPGVTAAGFLRKENPAQNGRLRAILGRSRAVVHPTRSDIAPLIAVEAGYFGCPVISSRSFAIPEIVEHSVTGILLDDPANPAAVARAMTWILEADAPYAAMRRAAWTRTRRMHTKARFEEQLSACVEAVLAEAAL